MISSLVPALISAFKARRELALENALRQQLAVLRRSVKRPRLSKVDRVFWVLLRRIWTDWEASCPKTQTNSRLARRAVSIVIDLWRAPDLGRVGGDVGDSGSPYAQGKHRSATRCHAPGRRPGSRLGPHLDQNVLAGYAAVALALILGTSGGLFSDAARPCQRPAPPLWRKRGTRKSRLETNTENEACSALLARLW